MEDFKVGDAFTISVPVYRRWWQFWKPRITGKETRNFIIKAVSTGSDGVITWPRLELEKP